MSIRGRQRSVPRQRQRALDHHERPRGRGSFHLDRHAAVVGTRPFRIVDGVVDRVDGAALRRIRRRRHGEVGVASRLAENRDLVVDAADLGARAAVVERPVPMDEPVGGISVSGPAEQTVSGGQRVAKLAQLHAHVVGGVVAVMKVDLHLPHLAGAEIGQRVDDLRPVDFERRKEAVLRRLAIRVAKRRQPRVVTNPPCDTAVLSGVVGVPVIGLEVIGNAEQDIDGCSGRTTEHRSPSRAQVSRQPELCVPR